jgi:dihydrofolate reductase
MKIYHVVAYQKCDLGIGYKNKLLWKSKQDMNHFYNLTKHNIVIMGRKTYESIGKPLSNRINIVLSRNKNIQNQNSLLHFFSNIQDAINWCEKFHENKLVFIIGGSEIYSQTEHQIDGIFATEIICNNPKDADTYYNINLKEFHKVQEKVYEDQIQDIILNFVKYQR